MDNEINRILELGVNVNLNSFVDKKMFERLIKEYDAVIAAIGAHVPFVIPVEGHEKIV